jgi:hypothetical protein
MNSFDKVYIQFATAGDGSATIRKWSQFPFDNGNEYTLTAALSHSPEEPGDPPPKDLVLGGDTVEFTLRAMAQNYAGGHSWDHLDGEACVTAANEIQMLRAGIKRLSYEEELCSETTGDDPFSMVYLAAKLASAEKERAEEWRQRRDAEGSRDAASAAADSLRIERDQLSTALRAVAFYRRNSKLDADENAAAMEQIARKALFSLLTAATEVSDNG